MKIENGVLVLEESTNTHVMHGVEKAEKITDNVITAEVKEGVVVHGEHGAIGIESRYVAKYTQTELNPVTKAFQNAFD